MAKYLCSICRNEFESAKPPKFCSGKKSCTGRIFTLVVQQIVFVPQVIVVTSSSMTEPTQTTDVNGNFLDIMIAAYERVYGDAGKLSSAYARMKQLKVGSTVLSKDVNDLKVVSKQLKAKLLASETRATNMTLWVGQLVSSKNETIWRNCTEAEALAVSSTKQLKQKAGASMDKYKWIFTDKSHPPVTNKKPPKCIHMTVPSGTVQMLASKAVTHLGGSDAPIVTRDTSITGATDETNEPGAFGVHGDVLHIFSKLIKAINISDNKY